MKYTGIINKFVKTFGPCGATRVRAADGADGRRDKESERYFVLVFYAFDVSFLRTPLFAPPARYRTVIIIIPF